LALAEEGKVKAPVVDTEVSDLTATDMVDDAAVATAAEVEVLAGVFFCVGLVDATLLYLVLYSAGLVSGGSGWKLLI
jgi:hypothetical protein